MHYLLALALVACACADVSHLPSPDQVVPIVRSTYDVSPDGGFQYAYETGNGISEEANGVLKKVDSEHAAIEVTGNVKYTSPEGVPIELSYIANEDGYQPQGSHLPVAPPIPEHIARSLEYIAAHPPPEAPLEKFASNRRARSAYASSGIPPQVIAALVGGSDGPPPEEVASNRTTRSAYAGGVPPQVVATLSGGPVHKKAQLEAPNRRTRSAYAGGVPPQVIASLSGGPVHKKAQQEAPNRRTRSAYAGGVPPQVIASLSGGPVHKKAQLEKFSPNRRTRSAYAGGVSLEVLASIVDGSGGPPAKEFATNRKTRSPGVGPVRENVKPLLG